MKRIHDSLAHVLARHRLVFWYDGAREWGESFDAFDGEGVVKLRVDGNEFGTKVRIVGHSDARFLVYIPAARPADAENWLLDLLLQGHEYRADRASLVLQEIGLSEDFRQLVEGHLPFFGNAKRTAALKALLLPNDEPRGVRLRMMAVLASAPADVDDLLLHFLGRRSEPGADDPVAESFGSMGLVEPFWREVERLFGYAPAQPSVRDFAVTLFRGANPLDGKVPLHPHARVFLQRWKDSQAHRPSYETWADQLEVELQVMAALDGFPERSSLGDNDTFEVFERFVLHRLAQAFDRAAPASELRAMIQQRRGSIWHARHADGYAALEHAVTLRELLESADITMDSVESGVRRYTSTWFRLDAAYRRCAYHLRRYGQVQVMEPVREWVERRYVNDFLLPLADRWSDQVRRLERWECDGVTAQRRFFETWVQPFRLKGQKVFVIVSDALRYEAAAEFAETLRAANRWTAEVDVAFGTLPSYTQLGMASLLPGREWGVATDGVTVTVDGRSASGAINRGAILAAACEGRAAAIKAEAFLNLNTKTEGRALMRDNDVIYIYHNQIDHVGDKAETEAQTADAVERAFGQLEEIIRKVANINGSNMLLTADHGFLFQQDPLDEGDMLPLPAGELTYRNRRYVLGHGIGANSQVKTFAAKALALSGNWTAAFPLSLGRFPLQGSGKRYVHGGLSLQEVVIPVVRIHKAREDDTGRVEVEALRMPSKITTGQLSVAMFQDRPAVDKVQPRTLRIGLFTKDGSAISEQKTVTFDSRDEEARLREKRLLLVLSGAADAHNNRTVELRLEEMVQGTSQWVTYRSYEVKLQKPFMSDFDEF